MKVTYALTIKHIYLSCNNEIKKVSGLRFLEIVFKHFKFFFFLKVAGLLLLYSAYLH